MEMARGRGARKKQEIGAATVHGKNAAVQPVDRFGACQTTCPLPFVGIDVDDRLARCSVLSSLASKAKSSLCPARSGSGIGDWTRRVSRIGRAACVCARRVTNCVPALCSLQCRHTPDASVVQTCFFFLTQGSTDVLALVFQVH